MAYTTSPTTDTHNAVRVPTLGSPVLVTPISIVDPTPVTLSYIDCFPQSQASWGEGKRKTVITKRNSWKVNAVVGPTNTVDSFSKSIVISEANDSAYFVRGVPGVVYTATSVSTTVPGVTAGWGACTGTLQTSGTMAVNNANLRRVVFLDNVSNLLLQDEFGGTTSTTALPVTVSGFRNIVFLNGYLFAANSESKIYNSDPGGVLTTWNTTNFIVPEIAPDELLWLDTHKNYLVAFGSNSIEFFYDAGIEVGSPLARQESYTSRIGIVHPGRSGVVTARINDDVYFIGRNDSNTRSLYRIRDFRVEEIENQYAQAVMNWRGTLDGIPDTTMGINGVERIIINNNPMILISLADNQNLVYYPDEDVWWSMSNPDVLLALNTDFPGFSKRIGSVFYTRQAGNNAQPVLLSLTSSASNTNFNTYIPDYSSSTSIVSRIYTEVIDFLTNRTKHFARVDAIGDYGFCTVTLSYKPGRDYGGTYITMNSITPSSIDDSNNISWYNLGGYRTITFRFDIQGAGNFLHEGFDIEYNVGIS